MVRRIFGILVFAGLLAAYYLNASVAAAVDSVNWTVIRTFWPQLSRTTDPLLNFGVVLAEAALIVLLIRVLIWRVRGRYVPPPASGGPRLSFMRWPRVRAFNEKVWPVAGAISPFVLAAHHVATYWYGLTIGVGVGVDWNSMSRWTFRIFAIYVILQAIAAVIRPTRQTATMIRDILTSTAPLFIDAIALYAYGTNTLHLSDYSWAWMEGDLWYVFIVDVIIFSTFMAEIDFYQAPITRQESLLPQPRV